jgi:hypothetical protein
VTPAVWADARARITAAAASLSLPVAWPNEAFTTPEPPAPWLAVEASASTDDPIELTGGMWQEDGLVWLHVMIPSGSGIDAGLTIRKSLANAFRSVTDAAVGLIYQGANFDPSGPGTDDGMYQRLTAMVSYIYQDRPV